jgi:hypothetical protein
MPDIYVALTHYPVVDKRGDIITSAITNLDLHDISRVVRTYGVKAFYVVTPLIDQQELIRKIISHWTSGYGAEYNPTRRSALEQIKIKETIAEAGRDIAAIKGDHPKLTVTSARHYPASVGFNDYRSIIKSGGPHLLIFGTAWGLAESIIAEADYILKPISGATDYNHLSVRCAAGIILDRLLGTG